METFFRTCFFTPPCPYTLWYSLNFHTSAPPNTIILSFNHSSNLIPSSFASATHHLQPSVTHSDSQMQRGDPHFDFKIPPHYYIYDTPKHIQSLLEHHQTPQTPPKSSYISSKHLSNPPRTIKHDFQHQQYTTDLEFTGT